MAPAIDVDINIIAEKDVPAGVYYKIFQDSDLPPLDTKDAWELEINKNNADGIGLTKEDFDVKYPQYKEWYVK